jgi:hypothetical protein
MTRKSTLLQAPAPMAIGSLLGYAATTMESARTAVAAPPPADSGPKPAVAGRQSRRADDSGRGTRLALAGHNKAIC